MVVIKIIEDALGWPSPYSGKYIVDFTPDTDELGRGELTVSENLEEAKMFADTGIAFNYWQQQSARVPFRPDGKPNRPLTAWTVEMLGVKAVVSK